MREYFILICFSFLTLPVASAHDSPSCRQVTLADIGWTDVTATTAVAKAMLERLGYEPKILLLSLPVTLKSLSTGDVDVFLGNWMPSQTRDLKPYFDSGLIEDLGVNLRGAKFTLAVTKAAFDAGVKTFADLSKHADRFKKKIYGIESGNEGNAYLLQIINKNEFGLGSFDLVESSEQGMLAEVDNASRENAWLAFLAWSPHPMNIKYSINYLSGADNYFGSNFGEAQVRTLARKNFQKECPNVAKLFKQLKFTVALEEEIMFDILVSHRTAFEASINAITKNPAIVNKWLLGIEKFTDARAKTQKEENAHIQLGPAAKAFTSMLTTRFSPVLRRFSNAIETSIGESLKLASLLPSWMIICLFTLIAFLLRRSFAYATLTAMGFCFIYLLGYFDAMLQTLVMTIMSTIVCMIIGIPLGILCAKHRRLNGILSPTLDMMQTLPTFVYLLPTLMLFGLGMVPGLISTIIFAIAAPIKFTCLGILQVPISQREAAASLGATTWQSLRFVEIPLAMPTIFAGISQCIMLSLSMVVIAALVGAEGLGEPVVRALNTVDIGMGFESGLTILILALVLGHLFPVAGNSNELNNPLTRL